MDQSNDAEELTRLRVRVATLEAELAAAQAQTAAAEKDARHWRHIIESLPEFVTIFDREGRYVYLNAIGPGYQGESYVGRPLSDFIDPRYWQSAFEAALAGQVIQYDVYDERRRHWFHCNVGPITLEDGQTYLVVTAHNADRLKEVEGELRDARELWTSLTSNSPDTILLLAPDARILFINRLLPGYTLEEVVGKRAVDFISPEQREGYLAALHTASVTRLPQFYEVRDARFANYWWVTLVPVRDGQRGDLVLAISQDVTEHHHSQEALRESELRLRLLLEQAPAILWTTDTNLKVTSASGSGLESLDITQDQWLGRHVAAVLNTVEPGALALSAHHTALAGQSVNFEHAWDDRTFHLHVEPLRDERSQIVGTVGLALDITSRVEVERAMRSARDDLELRVAQRTTELDTANRALREDIAAREGIEAKLRESEERFRIIADTVPVAIAITTLSDGKVLYVNHRFAQLLESTPQALLGVNASSLYAQPEDRARMLERLRETPAVLDLELELKCPTGKKMRVSGNYQLITFGGEACVLSGFVDLTHRIATERELRAERRLLRRLLELQQRDRQLLSYEIHDGIVQDMTAALMFFESSRPAELGEEHPTHDSFLSGVRLLRGSISEARRVINGLQPPVLEDEGVVAAVEALVTELERLTEIEIELVIDVTFRRLAPALEMAIYRIVQEGLNNVWHHSKSTKARVELIQRDDSIDIRVQDWGIGFDLARVAKRRYGLMGIRERARLLNGRAVIESSPGAGTRLVIELPLLDALMPNDEQASDL